MSDINECISRRPTLSEDVMAKIIGEKVVVCSIKNGDSIQLQEEDQLMIYIPNEYMSDLDMADTEIAVYHDSETYGVCTEQCDFKLVFPNHPDLDDCFLSEFAYLPMKVLSLSS